MHGSVVTARARVRVFRYVQEFLKSLTVKDDVERYLGLFKAFWLAVWMSMDHIQWLQKAGYLKLADLKKIDEVSGRNAMQRTAMQRPVMSQPTAPHSKPRAPNRILDM